MAHWFARDESGAVTVDWVVLAAAITGIGVAVVTTAGIGTTQLGGKVGDALGGVPTGVNAFFGKAAAGFRTLVEMTFDDGDFTGWSATRTGHSDALGTFLGPFGGADSLVNYQVGLPPGTQEARISFDMLILDSWDAETAGLSGARGDGMSFVIDGTEIGHELFMHSGHAQAGDFTAPRDREVTIGDTTYRTRMTLQDGGSLYGDRWTDQVWRVEVSAINPAPGGFELGMAATTNQSRSDESFGVRGFSVQAR